MPIPGDDLEVTDCVVIDHAYVGGRKQFLSELGLEDTASHLTAEKRELLESFLKIEDSLDQLQTDIIKAHPEAVKERAIVKAKFANPEDPRKENTRPISVGFMRWLVRAPIGLIAEPRPPLMAGVDCVVLAANRLLEDISSSLFTVTDSQYFCPDNFSNCCLSSKEFQWLEDRNSKAKVLAIHAEAVRRGGSWMPMIPRQAIDKEREEQRLSSIKTSCEGLERICANVLVSSRERGLAKNAEIMNYENHQESLPGTLVRRDHVL
jgi:hypothetical protein